MDLIYNDTDSILKDRIWFTQSSDGRWNVTEENIKKVEELIDTNKSLEAQLARNKDRIAYLTSEVKRLDKEASYWWKKFESEKPFRWQQYSYGVL